MTVRRPRTLLWRLALALMGAQLLIALAFGFYAHQRVRDFHYEQSLGELNRIAPLLVDRYANLMEPGDVDRLDRRVKEDGRRAGLRITIILVDGVVIADSDADPAQMDNHRHRPEIDAALTDGQGSATRYSNTLKASMMYSARRMGDEGGSVLRVAMPLTALEIGFARITRAVGIGWLAAMLITLAVIYLITRRFTGQVGQLAAGAGRFAAGDLDYRVVRPSALELSRIADALNEMARELDARMGQLRAQQSEQQAILQSMSNGVIALDGEQRILTLNRAAEQMLSIDAENTRGRLLHEVVREPELLGFVADIVAGEGARPVELTLSGEPPRTIQAIGEAMAGADGNHWGSVIVLNDLTDVRRFESLRSDFAANVSHELRTPITNIKGYVETLIDVGWEDGEQAGRFLEVIRNNSSRLAAIVEDVLALTRLEQREQQESLKREWTPVADVIGAVASVYEAAATAKDIHLSVEVPDGLRAFAYGPLIEQAVSNLVSNAVNYSPSQTTVTLRARQREDGEIEIAVIDEGPGIAAEHLPRLFERFYRADKARSRELGGTGLGLAIVKHIALVHGGRAEVESEPGRGSTFRLVLPVEEHISDPGQ